MLRILIDNLWVWKGIRWVLFLFPAESVHHFTTRLLSVLARWNLLKLCSKKSNELHAPVKILFENGTLMFRNPIGLAAGFDKNAECIEWVSDLGFGFMEIGTVTPLPQWGNPRPRLFRRKKEQALWNAMGFNNEGAEKVARRLIEVRKRNRVHPDFKIGVNLGKNKTTPDEKAVEDYLRALTPFLGWVDFVVINVSSPNTPGLRSLQNAEWIQNLLALLKEKMREASAEVPIWVKLSPELDSKTCFEIYRVLLETKTAVVLTNTIASEGGGVSGRPLTELSLAKLREVKSHFSELKVISVGGIFFSADACQRFQSGAELLEIYTGIVYNGPGLIRKLLAGYRQVLKEKNR